jgi:hypothetical protein
LSTYKNKEKWQETFPEAKLFLQKLRTTVYRQSRVELQRLSLQAGRTNFGLMPATKRIKSG